MASEVSHRHTATGETLYFTIRNVSRQMWNTAGTPNFETLTVANWADYDVALTESPASSYFYAGTFPAISGNMTAGFYWVDVFKRIGGSPAISDTLLASYWGYWDGTTYKWWAGDTTHIGGDVDSATRLSLSAKQIIPGTVDTTGFAATTTQFEADDITEATADHYNGRIVIFTSGVLAGQASDITDYSLSSGRGHFTVTALTEAPGNNDTFVIV
jgi:hypothetical protein